MGDLLERGEFLANAGGHEPGEDRFALVEHGDRLRSVRSALRDMVLIDDRADHLPRD
jgi:hypothetical protein